MSVINCALCQAPVDTDFDTTYEACEGCAVESDEQREEIAELRKDKARLDWYALHRTHLASYGDSRFPESIKWGVGDVRYADFRKATDAAMEADSK